MARNVVGDEPFFVLLGDDLVLSKIACCKQMINLYEQVGSSIVAVQRVPEQETHQYGIVEGEESEFERAYKISRMIEKPAPGTSNSDMAIIGRYLLMPEIFDLLEKTTPGHGGEIQLTDALQAMCKRQGMFAYEFEGSRYDAGDKLGYLKAVVDFALMHQQLGRPSANISSLFASNCLKSKARWRNLTTAPMLVTACMKWRWMHRSCLH
ncbi:MAG: UTP--glucose-1-phosphate uridylyltransferase [Desulfobulbus sp.]